MLTAVSAEKAHNLLTFNEVGVILSDQNVSKMDSTHLREVSKCWPKTCRIILSVYTEAQTITINDGATIKYLAKPWNDVFSS